MCIASLCWRVCVCVCGLGMDFSVDIASPPQLGMDSSKRVLLCPSVRVYDTQYFLLQCFGGAQGVKPVLLAVGTSNFIYFYIYNGLKQLSTSLFPAKNLGAHSDILMASFAGQCFAPDSERRNSNKAWEGQEEKE